MDPANIQSTESRDSNLNVERPLESNGPTLIEDKSSLSFEPQPKLGVKPELKPEAKPEVKSEVRETKENQGGVKASPTRRKEINNPFKPATSKVLHLVYWENPIYSGIVLASGFSIVIYTSFYSLINTFFALVISLLGLSWIVVTGKKQCQNLLNTEYANPFEHFLAEKPLYIERASLEKYLDVCVDGVNFMLQESQNIILVESPSRTFKHVISLYFLWTFLGWFYIRTLASIVLILGFSVPFAYKHNQVFVDEKLEKVQGYLESHLERVTGLLKHHSKGVYEKSRNFAVNKGWAVKEE